MSNTHFQLQSNLWIQEQRLKILLLKLRHVGGYMEILETMITNYKKGDELVKQRLTPDTAILKNKELIKDAVDDMVTDMLVIVSYAASTENGLEFDSTDSHYVVLKNGQKNNFNLIYKYGANNNLNFKD